MRVAVVGAGAIGGLLAYRLAAAGHTVSVVARGEHLAAIQRDGLRLYDRMQDAELAPLRMGASEEPAALGPQDAVFITLKAYAIPAMLPRLAPLLQSDTVAVPAINGMPWWYFHGLRGPYEDWSLRSLDPRGTMFRDLDPDRILGCVVHAAAQINAPGRVQHTNGWRFILGEPRGEPSARLQQVADAMRGGGFDIVVTDNIRTEVWWKLLGNLSFNPIAALHRKLIHEICEDEALRALLRPMMTEGMAVAARLGVQIAGTPDERIDVARKLRGAKISMHQDLEAGRTLELDAITKAVIEIADRLEVPVPTIRRVDAEVTALARSLGLYP